MPEAPAFSTGCFGQKKSFNEKLRESEMYQIPKEFAIGGVFMPPLFIAALVGIIAAVITALLLNRFRLSKYFFYPPLVFLALTIIYTVLIGTLIIGV
jgi:hypothetical protein